MPDHVHAQLTFPLSLTTTQPDPRIRYLLHRDLSRFAAVWLRHHHLKPEPVTDEILIIEPILPAGAGWSKDLFASLDLAGQLPQGHETPSLGLFMVWRPWHLDVIRTRFTHHPRLHRTYTGAFTFHPPSGHNT